MEVIKLNLIPGKACPVVHASQFDDGRDFKAELYEGVNVYTLDGTETLTAIVKKPDGNEVTVSVTNTSDNYVIITTTEQMTACAGGNLGTLKIEKGAVTIATLNFILECQASPDTGIQSDSEIHNLEAQVNQMVEDAVAEQYDSNNVLFDTAPTSGHGVPYAVTSGGLWSWLRDLPLRAYPTASGAIATFDTSLALPLQDCTIDINAVQESGTPTPSSPKLISGFTGANIRVVGSNLWDEEWLHGYYNTSGEYVSNANYLCSKNMSRVKPNTTYYYLVPAGYTGRIVYYDMNGGFISRTGTGTANNTFTTPANCYYIHLLVDNYSSDYNNDIAVLYPSSLTSYVAYNPNSTTTAITWQDEAGTVYGGSLDVTSGVLTVTHALTTLDGSQGSGSFRTSAKTGYTQTEWYDYRAIGVIGATIISDKFFSTEGIPTVLYGVGGSPNGERCFFGLPDTVTTPAEANTWFQNNPTVIVYPIATPVTYQLTPTQITAIVGTNNVFTDTNGDTSVVFACSLKDYIDGQ